MGDSSGMAGLGPPWGTFDAVRERLFDQFQNAPFDDETGLDANQLQCEVHRFIEAHTDLPRVLQKAHAFRIVVMRGRIAVDPHDWFADKLDHGGVNGGIVHGGIVQRLSHTWYAETQAGPLKQEADWLANAERLGAVHGLLDTGHISPGWENVFAGGLTALIARVERSREQLGTNATAGQLAFYEAVEIVYRGAIALSERFADLADKLAVQYPEHAARMQTVAAACRRVPAHAPRTFHEALQACWLMHELIEMEGEMVRSMGHFDRMLFPYYRADVDAGRLTREQAKELIKFLWIRFHARTRGSANGKNFVFAGQDRDGNAVTNELTYVALEAYEELNTPDPKLSIRFTPQTPDALHRRVADLIRRGHNSFVLMNDEPAVAALVKRGKTLEDARAHLPIGCYEPAVDGKEAACTMNIVVNLAKPVELALHDGIDPLTGQQLGPHTGDAASFTTFGQFYAAYTAQLDFLIGHTARCVNAHERHWPMMHPSPFIAGTIDDCIAAGRDIGQGGAHYNAVGCTGAGLANACDSLLALKQAVFDEKRFTMPEMLEALRADFADAEPLRQYLVNRVPKWGNADPAADDLAVSIAEHYTDSVHGFESARGGPFQASLFTLEYQWMFGSNTGALPDGRQARTTLAPGVGAAPGLDRNGVTGLIGSVTKLDFTETPNGSVLDVMLHPTALKGEDGLDAFVSLIKTFLRQGGYAVQFNVVDADTLRDAQRHPERYASLQIRVTGWSVCFTRLPQHKQDQFIARNRHAV